MFFRDYYARFVHLVYKPKKAKTNTILRQVRFVTVNSHCFPTMKVVFSMTLLISRHRNFYKCNNINDNRKKENKHRVHTKYNRFVLVADVKRATFLPQYARMVENKRKKIKPNYFQFSWYRNIVGILKKKLVNNK